MTRTILMDNVYLTYLPSEKFKTNILSAQMVTPLTRKTAGMDALLVNVLSRGTVRYPDMTALNRELDMLYGARLRPTVRKMGENHVFGFLASAVDDSYLPTDDGILEKLCDMVGEMFIAPATRKGRLNSEYLESERSNLVDYLVSERNDKITYAGLRLMEEMCGGEPYGVHRLGDPREVERISLQKLNTHYQQVLADARLELFYCGAASEKRVRGALTRAFAALPRLGCIETKDPVRPELRDTFRTVIERSDVEQGKLCIGYRTNCRDDAALIVMNVMLGGGPNSRLFLNVREKLSLCYYCGSVFHRQKGIITISSGIQSDHYEKALEAIEHEVDVMRDGKWEDWDLDSAMAYILNDLRSIGDSASSMENFVMSRAAIRSDETVESLKTSIESVTKERIMAAAQSLHPDTIYFLTGKEETDG